MGTIASLHDEPPVARIKGWLSRSVQGHLLVNWHCPACARWHINGWHANGEDGIRVSPKCLDHHRGGEHQVVWIGLHGDATPAIMRAISRGRAPSWKPGTRWPRRLLPPPPPPRTPERRQPRPSRVPAATPRPSAWRSVPVVAWRAAAAGIVEAWCHHSASIGAPANKRTSLGCGATPTGC